MPWKLVLVVLLFVSLRAQSDVCDDTLLTGGWDDDTGLVMYWYDMNDHASALLAHYPSPDEDRIEFLDGIAWSPDRRHAAYIHGESSANQGRRMLTVSDVYVAECRGDSAQRVATRGTAGRFSSVTWSPDSQQIAYIYDTVRHVDDHIIPADVIKTVNRDGTDEQEVYQGEEGLRIVGWTTHGIIFLFDNGLYVLEGGSPHLLFRIEYLHEAAISLDGKLAALHIFDEAAYNGYVALLDLDTMALTTIHSYGSGYSGQVLWSLDGSKLILSDTDSAGQFRIYLWQDGNLTEIGDTWGRQEVHLEEWTPDGSGLLVSFSPDLWLLTLSGELQDLPFPSDFRPLRK
jgi:Tol biopolymer transport system component